MINPTTNSGSEYPEVDYTLEITAEVVSSYVGNNPVSTNELPKLISEVYSAFARLKGSRSLISTEKRKPAVPIKKSLNEDYLICLEDGKKFKSLKRHLRSHFNLSPEDYRKKWGLPHDYPMVAPSYAKERSTLARKMGLGRKPGTKLK
ncbi:MAG: MucR family transcriptional regulator [Rhizobiaceae bacterium]